MAISKKDKRRGQGPGMPDAAAFVKVIDEGLAEPMVVSRAYHQAMHDWHGAGGRADLQPGDVVQERPVITEADHETPEARMIALGRMSTFLGFRAISAARAETRDPGSESGDGLR